MIPSSRTGCGSGARSKSRVSRYLTAFPIPCSTYSTLYRVDILTFLFSTGNPRPSLVFVCIYDTRFSFFCFSSLLSYCTRVTGNNVERLQWVVTPGEQMGGERVKREKRVGLVPWQVTVTSRTSFYCSRLTDHRTLFSLRSL